jgi:hypothetical protein
MIVIVIATSPKSDGGRKRERIANCKICNSAATKAPPLVHLIADMAFCFNIQINILKVFYKASINFL